MHTDKLYVAFLFGAYDFMEGDILNKKSILIRKVGLFYNVFDNDALIINYLFDYKIINNRCGFPINAIEKVKNTLSDKKVNYIIDDEMVDFKKENKYMFYLTKAIDKNRLYEFINEMKNKIECLDEEDMLDLISKIKELIDEY